MLMIRKPEVDYCVDIMRVPSVYMTRENREETTAIVLADSNIL